jgi:hypothetical protein
MSRLLNTLHKNTQVGGEIKMNAVNQQPATNNRQPKYQCRHIFTDGHRCGSICLRGEPFCYYHHTTRKPAPRQSLGRKSSFDLPLPEDRSAIQSALGIILQKIASNDLDSKRAGLLLYGLQIASLNLPKRQAQHDEDAPEQVHEITTDPEHGTLAPPLEIHEQKSVVAQLLEELRPKPAILPQIQATEDPTNYAAETGPRRTIASAVISSGSSRRPSNRLYHAGLLNSCAASSVSSHSSSADFALEPSSSRASFSTPNSVCPRDPCETPFVTISSFASGSNICIDGSYVKWLNSPIGTVALLSGRAPSASQNTALCPPALMYARIPRSTSKQPTKVGA